MKKGIKKVKGNTNIKGIKEPHEVKKKSFHLGGN